VPEQTAICGPTSNRYEAKLKGKNLLGAFSLTEHYLTASVLRLAFHISSFFFLFSGSVSVFRLLH
jgi:hypothetical protein